MSGFDSGYATRDSPFRHAVECGNDGKAQTMTPRVLRVPVGMAQEGQFFGGRRGATWGKCRGQVGSIRPGDGRAECVPLDYIREMTCAATPFSVLSRYRKTKRNYAITCAAIKGKQRRLVFTPAHVLGKLTSSPGMLLGRNQNQVERPRPDFGFVSPLRPYRKPAGNP